mmetsp:Transcript_51240/g.70370  ORF Transcript_51240/g.70370 Transcript_51240/m.70370 type:complete len:272 (-) Transcript_51240:2283-3098(-)
MINTLTIYALFVTPFTLVFTTYSEKVQYFELFVDTAFSLDIIFNFFKIPYGQKDLRKIQRDYLFGFFIFDCGAAIPGLVTLEDNDTASYFKLLRLVHWNRFFKQLNIIFEKVLLNWLSYNRQKVSEIVSLVKLLVFVLLATHIIACLWIVFGRLEGGWVLNGDLLSDDHSFGLYTSSFYFVLTTITTVGYGDISGGSAHEYIFCMCVEFIGLTFFSFLLGTISIMLQGEKSFEQLINERLAMMDLWLRRLELSNQKSQMPGKLYLEIKRNI